MRRDVDGVYEDEPEDLDDLDADDMDVDDDETDEDD